MLGWVVHGGLAVTLHEEAAGALWVLICWRTSLIMWGTLCVLVDVWTCCASMSDEQHVLCISVS